jgi:hypothetical protein
MSGTKLSEVTSKWKEHAASARLDRMDRENDQLRTEIGSLRSLLDREHHEREELLESVKRKPAVVVKKKKSSVLRALVVGIGAYIVGARAGRERYEQIVGWFRGLRSEVSSSAVAVASVSTDPPPSKPVPNGTGRAGVPARP